MPEALHLRQPHLAQPGAAVVLHLGGVATVAPGQRAVRAHVGAPWGSGTARRAALVVQAKGRRPVAGPGVVAAWLSAPGRSGALQARWGLAGSLLSLLGWVVSPPRAVAGWAVAPWRLGQPQGRATGVPWGPALPAALHGQWLWGRGQPAGVGAAVPWGRARLVLRAARLGMSTPQQMAAVAVLPWRPGLPLWGRGAPWDIAGPADVPPWRCWVPPLGNAVVLHLDALHAVRAPVVLHLHCGQIKAFAVVPVLRVYMVTNVTNLLRVSDGVPIPCFGFTLSLDVDSWAWGFSASLPATALPLVEPDVDGEPVELEAVVNGSAFRVIAESLSRERTFGQSGVRVQGRGKTAVLDGPYSAQAIFSAAQARTSQQLIDEALPAGWTADWQLTPWLVPGGIWSHQGTPITAAAAVAAAGGGYLQPHASANSILILPRYPVAPWDWAGVAPDIELPSAAVVREAIEWSDRARYNGVVVTGTTVGGVQRLVKRAGTAGDVLATMIADPLTTHDDAARQRAMPVLAATGRMAGVTLRLPVLAQTGVITPGKFLRYVDGSVTRLGLSRSVGVEVQGPEVWQTIKMEVHT